jgi:MFS family permease
MTEPDVTLTDFALALEGAVFVAILWRSRSGSSNRLRAWLLTYFAAAGIAALSGGIVHGYFLESGVGREILWRATLCAIGINALAAWAIGALLIFPPPTVRRVVGFAVAITIAYSAVVLFGVSGFVVAIAMALPATLFLLAALLVSHWRDSRKGTLLAASGVATTLAAAFVQQLGVGAHSVYFNHNATAHVVQTVAMGLIFAGSLKLLHANGDEFNRRTSCHRDASF